MFESTHDFIAKLQKRKMMQEDINEEKFSAEEHDKKMIQHSKEPEAQKKVRNPKKPNMKMMKKPKEQKVSKQPESGKHESVNESIFVLAGIEEILADEKSKTGALGALDIINNYMGGKIEPEYQEFIDMFKNSLKRDTK